MQSLMELQEFDAIINARQFNTISVCPGCIVIEHVKDLNADQTNHIFPGFNNNIIWNLGIWSRVKIIW